MVTLIDYSAMGFRLTLRDAATVLGLSLEELTDMVLAGQLTALLTADTGGGQSRAARVRLHPDEVQAYAHRRRTGELSADAHNASRVHKVLREYLEARPPVDSYEKGLLDGCAVRAAGRGALTPVHVLPEFVEAFHAQRGGEFPIPASVIVRGLESLGAVAVKGWIALADRSGPNKGRQRWKTWYRLPHVMTQPFDEHVLAAGLLGRNVEPDEDIELVDGRAVLAQPLTPTPAGAPKDYDPGEEFQGDWDDV